MNLKTKEKMKTERWNYKLYLIIIALVSGLAVSGQTFEKSRTVREGFKITPNVEVQVINKYGDIHLVPWEKDSVVFEIRFSVTSNKQAKVDKIFEYVDFDFRPTAYYVIAQTVFAGQNTFWTEMTDMANTIFSGGTSTRIDYTVYYPKENDIKLENKFGNIYTTEHTGKVDITLSNGDMKAYAFRGPTKLKLEFSNISVDKIVNANISLGYAEMNVESAGELILETRSSKLYINYCDKIHLNSKRDRIYLKQAGEITGELFFSNLNVDEATSLINLKTSYGDLKIMDVSGTFTRMDFATQYSDVNLYLDEDHFFELEVTRDDRSEILASVDLLSRNETPVPGSEDTFKAIITAGKQGKTKVPVVLNLKAGKFFLFRK